MTEVLLNMTTDQGIAPTYYPGNTLISLSIVLLNMTTDQGIDPTYYPGNTLIIVCQ